MNYMMQARITKGLFYGIACLLFALVFPVAEFQAYGQSSSSASFQMGVNILWGGGDTAALEKRFARMKSLGLTEARIDWEWRAVESKKGIYNWSSMDQLMSLAAKNGIALFPIVHYAPNWALPTTKKPDGVYEMAPREDAFAAYAKFLAASIDRYGPQGKAPVAFKPIKYWQVWNEPNGKEFWGPSPNAASFVKLMKAVDKTLGQRRRNIALVHAGLSKADSVFLWQLWDNDPDYGQLFDIMAVHPYFFNPSGGVRPVDAIDSDDPESAPMGFIGSKYDGGFLSKIFNIQLFLTLKKAPKPIWITEIGFIAGKGNPYAISESNEAVLASKTLAFIDGHLTDKPFGKGARGDLPAHVEKVFWFSLDDYGFPQDTGNFGMFRMDGSPRPLADVIKNFLLNGRLG
jgi:hypothetical protein